VSFVHGVVPEQLVINSPFRFSDPRLPVRAIFGDEVAKKIKPAWGVNEEGEISGVWADSGIEGLYQMMGAFVPSSCPWETVLRYKCVGNLAMCRFFSKHVALRKCFQIAWSGNKKLNLLNMSEIKAVEEGLFSGRYRSAT
jgi:hypothetical protein